MKPVIAGLILFFMLVWIPVESAWSAFCFNNYDLGIYGQAIQTLSWNAWNPWLSTRDVYLFNDHFDPILFLVAPLRVIMPAGLALIRVEMLALLVAASAPLWLVARRLIRLDLGLCAAAVILFSPLTLDAAFFPAHPGTWSLAPLSWMFAFLFAGLDGYALMALAIAMMCKEEYPVVGASIGAAMLLMRRTTSAAGFIAVSVLWGFGVFVVRPWIIGPASMYTDAVSQGDGISLLFDRNAIMTIGMRIVQLLLPLLALMIGQKNFLVVWRSQNKILVPLACLVTLLAIRLAGGYWGNHRVAPLAVAGAYLLVFGSGALVYSRVRLAVFAVCLMSVAFPSLEFGTRVWRGKPFKKHCPADAGRLNALHDLEFYLRGQGDGTVLAQGNLVSHLVDVPGIAQVGATKSTEFRYFAVEKLPLRNTWPLSPEHFSAIEATWRANPANRVIQDNEFVLLMENTSVP